mgnify:FL=1
MIVLWAASMYLFKEKKNFWITAVPATFMSAVSSTYFVLAPECLGGLLNSKTAEGATIYNTAVMKSDNTPDTSGKDNGVTVW